MPKVETETGLTDKQIVFCKRYLATFNGAQSAIDAGYSKKTARSIANVLLKNPKIQEYLRIEKDKLFNSLDITKDRVLTEIGRIALSDVRKLYTEDNSLKKIGDLDDHTAAAVSGVEVEEIFVGRGEDREHVGNTVKLKLWPKDKGLEMLAKHFKIFSDAPVINNDISIGYGKEE